MKVKLGDISTINRQTIGNKFAFSKMKYLDTSSITNGFITNIQEFDYPSEDIPSRAQRVVKDRTIIYSTVRPRLCHYGILMNPDENLIVSTGFVTIDVDTSIADPIYIFNILRNSKITEYLGNIADTAVSSYPSISPDDLRNLELDILEDINEQKKIGDLLNNIDKKIEINNKIQYELEIISKTLYDYWFLQFDFPNDEGKPYKSSGGKMVYNEELKCEIPEDWDLRHACEIADIKTGKEDANHATKNGKYPFFTCSNDILKCDDYKFEGNVILIAGNGDFNVKHYSGKFNAYQRTYVIKPYDEKYAGLFHICCKESIERFKKGSNGSIVKFITLSDIQNIKMLDCKNDRLLEPFNIFLEKIDSLKKENQELLSLREFLLPLLINGHIRFKNKF
jgi:type I restriction enzyme S subunit